MKKKIEILKSVDWVTKESKLRLWWFQTFSVDNLNEVIWQRSSMRKIKQEIMVCVCMCVHAWVYMHVCTPWWVHMCGCVHTRIYTPVGCMCVCCWELNSGPCRCQPGDLPSYIVSPRLKFNGSFICLPRK